MAAHQLLTKSTATPAPPAATTPAAATQPGQAPPESHHQQQPPATQPQPQAPAPTVQKVVAPAAAAAASAAAEDGNKVVDMDVPEDTAQFPDRRGLGAPMAQALFPAEKFDGRKGARFSTYATTWIRSCRQTQSSSPRAGGAGVESGDTLFEFR